MAEAYRMVFQQVGAEIAGLLPVDQREPFIQRFVAAASQLFEDAVRRLDLDPRTFVGPNLLEKGEWTLVPLDSIHFNLTTWRYYYTAAGEYSAPWEGLTISEKLYAFAVALWNPEPTPKSYYMTLKLDIKDYPYKLFEDLAKKPEVLRCKLLTYPLVFPPQSKIQESKIGVLAGGYDSLQFLGGVYTRVAYVLQRDRTIFYA